MAEFEIDAMQYKKKYSISELLNLPINRPELQRDLNIDTVKHIIDFQSKRFEERGSFLFIGDLQVAININDHSLYLIDGQHRYYSILTTLHTIMPDYIISINFIKISPQPNLIYPSLEEAFILINKYTPIPQYILDCCSAENINYYKNIIDQFRTYIKREYKSYISDAKVPRSPNINLDKMCNKIMKDSILLFQYIENGRELFNYMKYVNINVWTHFDSEKKGNKIKDKPLYAFVQYNLSRDNDWTSSIKLLNEFKVSNTTEGHAAAGINATIDTADVTTEASAEANARKGIPKKIKSSLWKKYYGEVYNSLCLICNDPISIENFEAGHIIAVAKGGTNHIDNLKPICIGCNRSMGDQDMNVFKECYYAK
jgi:5-methylcytosine-specific restriction endonuclease McrA